MPSPPFPQGSAGRTERGGHLLVREQCFLAFPRFLIHISPLMSGMEHPSLLWLLGDGTEKCKINEKLCEWSLKQLGIAGHNCMAGQMGTSGSLPPSR